jgi:carboxypeptidase D
MIKALVISDNPGTLEGEPAVRLTGGIHGNEMMSVELLIRFIEYLTYNYNTNPDIKNLIDSRYICIIPVLNPDGFAVKSRYNSNGVDLNRNFDDADNHWTSDSRSGSSPFSESESKALRDFSIPKNFNISITYHIGAVLVNLPFDFGKEIEGVYPVQNNLIKSYAKTYTNAGGGVFLTNPNLYVSPYMSTDGWINGGNWYVANGTLQDWSYTVTGCLDLTIEVARRNPSTEAGVQQVFMYNRDSIVAYIERAGENVFTGE